MIVLQLAATGDIPVQCGSAMRTVEQWATRRGHAYHLIRFDIPDGWDVRAYSNQIRAEWAATTIDPLLYADWDIVLAPDFEVSCADVRWHDRVNPDALFYVPEHDPWWCEAAAQLLKYNEAVSTSCKEPGRLWKIMRSRLTDKDNYFDGGYNHFHYSKR